MRGKKGLDYIDWSISMGIFIIAVTALFVFLKPGARPDYDQDTLLSLVQEQFVKQTHGYVHETPLFIARLEDKWGLGDEALVNVRTRGDMRFTAINPSNNAHFEAFVRTGTSITFNCHDLCDNVNFTIIGTTQDRQNDLSLESECVPSNQPSACSAQVGATSTREGVKQSEIALLRSEDYLIIKQRWAYPHNQNFAIYQEGNKIIGAEEPGQQANVYAKEFKMNIINDQGIQTPTTINIKAW